MSYTDVKTLKIQLNKQQQPYTAFYGQKGGEK